MKRKQKKAQLILTHLPPTANVLASVHVYSLSRQPGNSSMISASHPPHTHAGPGEVYKKIPCKSVGDLRDSSIRHTAPLCHCLIPTAASGCKAAAKEGLGIKLIIPVICRVREKKKQPLPTTWEKEATGRSDSHEDENCYGLVPENFFIS